MYPLTLFQTIHRVLNHILMGLLAGNIENLMPPIGKAYDRRLPQVPVYGNNI